LTASPRSTVFPYTTLFRSKVSAQKQLLCTGRRRLEGRSLARSDQCIPCWFTCGRCGCRSCLCQKARIENRPERQCRGKDHQKIQDRKSTRLNSSHVSSSYA